MKERIPERLVRVDYELPPLKTIDSVFFEDYEMKDDAQYERALHTIYPRASLRNIVRNVKPTSGD